MFPLGRAQFVQEVFVYLGDPEGVGELFAVMRTLFQSVVRSFLLNFTYGPDVDRD